MLQFGSAALGSLLGGSIGIGSRTGWMLGSLIAGQFGKKQTIEGRRLSDLSVQTSTYGKPIPLIYGHAMLKGNIIWTSGITETAKVTKERVNLLQKVELKDYEYHVSLALGLCAGVTSGLIRIWANGKLIYDKSAENKGKVKAFPFTVRFYTGSETQNPDPLILKKQGSTPAFRGLSYVVFEDFSLKEFNNHIPQFTFEVSADISAHLPVVNVSGTDQEADNICFSQISPWLFLRDKNKITCLDRDTHKIEQILDMTDRLPKTDLFASDLCGRMLFDEDQACLYGFAQHQLNSFIVKIDPLSGMIQADNFEHKIVADEQVGFVDGQLLYTADFLKGIVRVYQSSDLSRLYEIPAAKESGLHLRPTNFIKDHEGFIWLGAYEVADLKRFYLTRLKGQHQAEHHLIEGYGQLYGLCFDEVTQKIYATCSEGLLKIDPLTVKVEGHLKEAKGFGQAFSASSFAAQYTVSGALWLARHGEAIKVDLSSVKVSEKVKTPSSLRAAVYDPDHDALWFKGGALSKVLLGRVSPAALSLPAVVSDLTKRAGVKLNEQQVELKNDMLQGFIVPHPMALGKALKPLSKAYFFYIRSHEDKLNFFDIENKKPIEIRASDVGAFAEKGNSNRVEIRGSAADLPGEIEVHYASTERHFGAHSQIAQLHSKPKTKKVSLDLPLLLKDDEARKIADKMLHLIWQRRRTVIFTLPPKYMFLEVGDSVKVVGKEIIITKIVSTDQGLMQIEGWS